MVPSGTAELRLDDRPIPIDADGRFLIAFDRGSELELIAAARARITDAQGWRQRFIWPRTGRISGLFGSQRIHQGTPGACHGGVDIAGATGDPVIARADGVVTLADARPFTLEGCLLMIDHGHGLSSAFLHLSRIDVKLGQPVLLRQPIGATGRATGPLLLAGTIPAR